MANRRMIISEMWEDDFFIALSYVERLAWIGLITCMADDQGRFQDNPGFVRSHIFPNDEIDINSMEAALQSFHAAGKILRYTLGNKRLIQVMNWWKHQKPTWAAPSLFPAPEGWQDRCRYNGPGGKQILVNWDKDGGYILDNIPDKILDNIPDSLSKDKQGLREEKDTPPLTPDSFEFIQRTIEGMTGYPARPIDMEPIKEFVTAGINQADLSGGYLFLKGTGKRIFGVAELRNCVMVEHSKRIQAGNNGNGHKPDIEIAYDANGNPEEY